MLVEGAEWMPLNEGVIADSFGALPAEGKVCQLIALYGSNKKFLEQIREDFNHQFLVDGEANLVNLKDVS